MLVSNTRSIEAIELAPSTGPNVLLQLLQPTFTTLKLESRIGVGSFGQVFSAIEHPDGRVVAVKKSRVSINVSRTLLQHEADVLCLMRGHPAIPEVYALGRFAHFEYLSMELLGGALDFSGQDLDSRTSNVALVASQMISALKHVHGLGIVHRDVKPDNMLSHLRMPSKIMLIDFGIARTIPNDTRGLEPSDDPTRTVVGTITYASLNAHSGLPLTRRDDVESLAYTLFEYLRTDRLPWDKEYPIMATTAFTRRQMHEGKRAWSGERLANGYEAIFGEFLEEMRAMEFEAIPDYQAWVNKFSKLVKSPVDLHAAHSVKDDEEEPEPQRSEEPPVRAGQLVYVRILPKASIEGFPASRGPISEWQDPTLSDTAWPTTYLPAIVLCVSPVHLEMWAVSLLALTRRKPDSKTHILLRGEDFSSTGEAVDGAVTVLGEGWPEDDVWCDNMYVRNTFIWTPDQDIPIPSHWTISKKELGILVGRLGKPDPNHRLLTPRQLWSLRRQDLYVEGKELNPNTLDAANWHSSHAWLVAITPITARWAQDDCMQWLTRYESPEHDKLDRPKNSYYGDDYEAWRDIQHERDKSATLGMEKEACLEALLGKIREVL